jgi:photosystem II stability/assembly factor-like uncharacterized protein
MHSLFKLWQRVVVLLAVVVLCFGCSTVASLDKNPWQVINLPSEANFQDINFTDDGQHGWLVGSKSTILETKDGGSSWQPLALDLDDQRYLFSSVSFKGQEGWIAGEPSILLHTDDGGKSWEQIPLSAQLPGKPNTIVALGPNSAEMTTDVGAIYRTQDGGKNWKAMVQEAVGVLRNIARSADGKYLAVSAKGNFYSTWEPGQEAWQGHNRNSSRRVQNMGFGKDGRLWMLARGGRHLRVTNNSRQSLPQASRVLALYRVKDSYCNPYKLRKNIKPIANPPKINKFFCVGVNLLTPKP